MICAGRSLFKIRQAITRNVLALITAPNESMAVNAYYANGGDATNIEVERMTFGYPEDVCKIY